VVGLKGKGGGFVVGVILGFCRSKASFGNHFSSNMRSFFFFFEW
jgi:hypothetical protein